MPFGENLFPQLSLSNGRGKGALIPVISPELIAMDQGRAPISHNEKARTPMNHAKTATSRNAKPARAMLASFFTDHCDVGASPAAPESKLLRK
jgi:hypothetical protein